MTELTHVISSTGLIEDSAAPVEIKDNCPREYLNLSCVADLFDCVCTYVESTHAETVEDKAANPIALRLNLNLIQGMGNPYKVMEALNMTTLKADYQIGRTAVEGTFLFSRVQNRDLALYVRQIGL